MPFHSSLSFTLLHLSLSLSHRAGADGAANEEAPGAAPPSVARWARTLAGEALSCPDLVGGEEDKMAAEVMGGGQRRQQQEDDGGSWRMRTTSAARGWGWRRRRLKDEGGGGGGVFFIFEFFSWFFLFACGQLKCIRAKIRFRMLLRRSHAKITIFAYLFFHATHSTAWPFAKPDFVGVQSSYIFGWMEYIFFWNYGVYLNLDNSSLCGVCILLNSWTYS